jgi:hypothetical protein
MSLAPVPIGPSAQQFQPDSLHRGRILAFAGKNDAALHMIRMAIEHNYCAYSALENDPLLDKVRSMPEFRDLLMAARFCQEPLLAGGKAQ